MHKIWEASYFNPLNKSAVKEIMILIPPQKKERFNSSLRLCLFIKSSEQV